MNSKDKDAIYHCGISILQLQDKLDREIEINELDDKIMCRLKDRLRHFYENHIPQDVKSKLKIHSRKKLYSKPNIAHSWIDI